MKLVPENLFEANFERGQSPKGAMGIGMEGKLFKEVEDRGYDRSDVVVTKDFVIYPKQDDHRIRYGDDDLKRILVKYMHDDKKALAHLLMNGRNSSSKNIQDAIQKSFDGGMSIEAIEQLIKSYSEDGNTRNAATIQLAKLTRTPEKEQFDDEYNTYIFLGYMDKVPVEVNGKQYYEDKFVVENMVKIDMYNPNDLNMVSGLKLRQRMQNYPDSGVYAVKVPKELMDEDNYYDIPDHMQEIIEKYKFKV